MSCLYEIPADLDKIPFVVSSLMGCGPAATLPVPSVLIFDVSTHLDVGSRINSHGLNVGTGGNFCIWHVCFWQCQYTDCCSERTDSANSLR